MFNIWALNTMSCSLIQGKLGPRSGKGIFGEGVLSKSQLSRDFGDTGQPSECGKKESLTLSIENVDVFNIQEILLVKRPISIGSSKFPCPTISTAFVLSQTTIIAMTFEPSLAFWTAPNRQNKSSVALYRAMPGNCLSDTPLLRAMGRCLNMTNWVRYPPPFSEPLPLGEHVKWRCDTPPPTKGVSQRYLRNTT